MYVWMCMYVWMYWAPKYYVCLVCLCVSSSGGDLYPSSIFNSPELVASAQQSFIRTVWRDCLGFAGAKMVLIITFIVAQILYYVYV